MRQAAEVSTANVPGVITEQSRHKIGDLYLAHGPAAARLAFLLTGNRNSSEDIAQEAFVKLIGRFHHLRNPESVRAYLMRTVVNLSKNHHRRHTLENEYLKTHGNGHEPTVDLPDVEQHDELLRTLQDLPQRQRAALVLRYCEDFSEEQTADAMQTTVKAVKSLVGRGMETLRARTRGDQ